MLSECLMHVQKSEASLCHADSKQFVQRVHLASRQHQHGLMLQRPDGVVVAPLVPYQEVAQLPPPQQRPQKGQHLPSREAMVSTPVSNAPGALVSLEHLPDERRAFPTSTKEKWKG